MGQLRSSPRKLNVADSELNEASRPKTSFTATSSPLSKDAAKSHTGKATRHVTASSNTTKNMNAKKRLAVPPQGLRPQTSPEVVSVKNHGAASRTPGRLRKSNSKYKAGNAAKINSNFLTESVPEEKPKVVVLEDNDNHGSEAEVLVLTGLRAAADDMISEEAGHISAHAQGYGDLGNIGRSSSSNKQLKEPSPPSRNNRYGNGIKTKLAKLFNKGNACMEEPKVIEPQRNQDINHVPHYLSLANATSGNHRPTR